MVNLSIYQIEKKNLFGMIDSDYLYKLEQISRENIQKNSHNPTYAFEARIKRRATTVPNDRIKFDFSTAVA